MHINPLHELQRPVGENSDPGSDPERLNKDSADLEAGAGPLPGRVYDPVF